MEPHSCLYRKVKLRRPPAGLDAYSGMLPISANPIFLNVCSPMLPVSAFVVYSLLINAILARGVTFLSV